ncbi:SDR family oxidoreductase [Staphylococcus kloosii]|jgi:NAD(P)-dependent dehydrogenase (short-subunit alcohol dehydrogenase family)|uniref:Dioxygenase n=1 Tax=Staphylococcus kloosii TaxID=29384 RepID=A0ABQ0XMZ9_9STAP|nr:SDR family oxidoreductase [Staphylococcus kloosii]AVQ37007.1 KR domain-containing protein [Staphylococcus kloosii]PNZ03914.1 D-mannonate oxidoreductase [Staphylococcus kloosii]GEP82807.1 dioxygenase [Staphylococcus kloosii]SUM50113.1 D-mannonate oxidoreductase [Staphylococcus kloosii]
MTQFENLNIVITGATGVIGSTFVKALVDQGANVGILGRSEDKIVNLQQQIDADHKQTVGLVADVLDKKALEQAKKTFNQTFGQIDVLINGAGGNNPNATTDDEMYDENSGKSFFDLTEDGVDQVFKLNYTGTFLPSQVFGQDVVTSEQGTIINISSMNAFTPLTKIPAYSGAKASVSNFTQWLSTYFAGQIRVNAIAPGFFETAQNKGLLRNDDGSYSERANKILSQTPMQRFGEPEELLGTLYWLIDNKQSGFVTGVVVPVDGGFNSYSGV